jgi:prepilin-type N-terminal cleavage/methylation domain-containing protein/prepilin-type processing-associated H-X9-DG protein
VGRGVTLLEVLTVVAIIGVLVAIALPVLGRAREAGNVAACASNLRQFGLSVGIAADHTRIPWGNDTEPEPDGPAREGEFPSLRITAKQVLVHIDAAQCPSDRETRAGVATAVLDEDAGVRASYDVLTAWTIEPGDAAWARIKDLSSLPIAWDINGGLSRERAAALPDDERRAAIRRANHYPRGGNVVYADGHVAWKNAQDWKGINDPGIPDSLKAP